MINSVKYASRRVKHGSSFVPFGSHYRPDDSKYSALNLCRVTDLGTFEFRTFGGLDMKNTKKFEQWITQLEFLREHAIKLGSPRALSEIMDKLSPDLFAKEFLTPAMYQDYLALPMAIRHRMISENEIFIAAVSHSIGSWDTFSKEKKINKNKPSHVDMNTWEFLNVHGLSSSNPVINTGAVPQPQGYWANVVITDDVEDNF
jgi:hypothetical protein